MFEEYSELLALLTGLIFIANDLGQKLQQHAALAEGVVGANRKSLEDAHVTVQLRLLEMRQFAQIAKTDRVVPWRTIASDRGRRFWSCSFGDRLCVPMDEFVPRMERMCDNGRFSARIRDDIASYIDSSLDGIVSCVEFGNFLVWASPWEGCIMTMERMIERPWFWGFLSKEEADFAVTKLGNGNPGAFLVRFSTSKPGSIAVTFMAGDPPRVVHTQLTQMEDASGACVFRVPWDQKQAFRSVHSLIECYSQHFALPVCKKAAARVPQNDAAGTVDGLPVGSEGGSLSADLILARFTLRTAPEIPAPEPQSPKSNMDAPDGRQPLSSPIASRQTGSAIGRPADRSAVVTASATAAVTAATVNAVTVTSPSPSPSAAAPLIATASSATSSGAQADDSNSGMRGRAGSNARGGDARGKAGVLRVMQRRGPFSSWKSRWIVLQGAVLSVYRDAAEQAAGGRPKHALRLARGSTCTLADGDALSRRMGPNVFECVADASTSSSDALVLQAVNLDEAVTWMAAIERAIEMSATRT
eukprot:Opistho-2@88220